MKQAVREKLHLVAAAAPRMRWSRRGFAAFARAIRRDVVVGRPHVVHGAPASARLAAGNAMRPALLLGLALASMVFSVVLNRTAVPPEEVQK